MSSLTISSTTAIVASPRPESPSATTPTAGAAVNSPARPASPQPPPPSSSRRPRWPGRSNVRRLLPSTGWAKGLKLIRVQQCFLLGVALLELLSVIIIVVLNAAGQNSDTFDISAPEVYLLNWTKNVTYEASRDNQTETFTLYWYLNGVAIQNGSDSLKSLTRHPGADFNWRLFDNAATEYIREKKHPQNTCGALPAFTPTNSTKSRFDITHLTSSSDSNSTGTASNTTAPTPTTTAGCRLPTADAVTDPPPALSGQPSFGRVSFAFYIIDIAVTLLVWPLNLFLGGSRPWQKRGRLLMGCTKAFATAANVIAASLLISGMSWVARQTSKDGASAGSFTDQDNTPTLPLTDDAYPLANNVLTSRATPNATSPVNATMPTINAGSTASSLIWISVISQVFACVFFIAACLLLSQQQRSQGEQLGSGRGLGNRQNMRQRPGSLPVYRPRDSNARRRGEDGEEYEDLPPYQREDPLGRPPSIPGYTISNGCTVTYSNPPMIADCIPLHRVTSSDASASTSTSTSALASSSSLAPVFVDNSGRRSPSPDYEEVVGAGVGVEPVSLLSSEVSGTQNHEPVLVTEPGRHTGDEEIRSAEMSASDAEASPDNAASSSSPTQRITCDLEPTRAVLTNTTSEPTVSSEPESPPVEESNL